MKQRAMPFANRFMIFYNDETGLPERYSPQEIEQKQAKPYSRTSLMRRAITKWQRVEFFVHTMWRGPIIAPNVRCENDKGTTYDIAPDFPPRIDTVGDGCRFG
jgi:hypothetical protein